MSEDTRKNSRNDAKEQRKKRQGRHNAAAAKKVEKAPEKKPPTAPEIAKEPEKPACEPPGPEFYSNLKRETDEILKITEEANTKYKKKEIQSNWAKYEMPIESYDEIDEQENLGADYETLIQASFSIGGHFQFKHEKSWDITTGPTPYDKYFEINMESLNIALSTIPFYERNCIDKSVFSESDIQSMDHRAMKFKQKYYNDKKYTTPDLEAQDKILNNLRNYDNEANIRYTDQNDFKEINIENVKPENIENVKTENIENVKPENTDDVSVEPQNKNEVKDLSNANKTAEISIDHDMILNKTIDNKERNDFDELLQNVNKNASEAKQEIITVPKEIELPKAPKEYTVQPKAPEKNPIIESPEDLEKWLDDFLDG